MVTVDELCRDDWPTLEKLRLDALTDAPAAFVTTVAAETGLPQDYWEAQFEGRIWIRAWDGGDIVGIAALVQPDAETPPDCRFIESVWVEPGHRGRGVLRQMLANLEQRAIGDGARDLRLWVLDSNTSAATAYQNLGFGWVAGHVQDTVKPGSVRRFVQEHLMSKSLG